MTREDGRADSMESLFQKVGPMDAKNLYRAIEVLMRGTKRLWIRGSKRMEGISTAAPALFRLGQYSNQLYRTVHTEERVFGCWKWLRWIVT